VRKSPAKWLIHELQGRLWPEVYKLTYIPLNWYDNMLEIVWDNFYEEIREDTDGRLALIFYFGWPRRFSVKVKGNKK